MDSGKRLISMSLYGGDPKYIHGALLNAELAPVCYPGWTLRVYLCERDLDPTPLREAGVEVIEVPYRSRIHSGMYWRFFAAWEDGVERVIFRDADSRLNVREAYAVRAWIRSGADAHCMKDHRHHAMMPIMGGMWGIKGGVLLPRLGAECRKKARRKAQRVDDMRWLRDRVHPVIEGSLLRHSSVKTEWPHLPFPPHPEYEGFVGQQYDQEGQGVWP